MTEMDYLLAIIADARHNPKEKPSLTRVGKNLNVNRSSVFRALAGYRRDGILDGSYRLTEEGRSWLEENSRKIEQFGSWLCQHNIPREQAAQDAQRIMGACSGEAARILANLGDLGNACSQCQMGKKRETTWNGFQGEYFCEKFGKDLPDGLYQMYYQFLKEKGEEVHESSMANAAFEGTAALKIENGVGTILLNRKVMHQQAVSGRWYSGMAGDMLYERNGKWVQVGVQENTITIPLSAFWISLHKQRGDFRGLLRLKLDSTAGAEAMPVQYALLEIWQWYRNKKCCKQI